MSFDNITPLVAEFINRPLVDIAKEIIASTGRTKHHEGDNLFIDIILIGLYKDGSKRGLEINKAIFKPLNIELSNKDIVRLSNLTIATGYAVKGKNGYGDDVNLCLNDDGFNLIRNNGSWIKYLDSQDKEKRGKDSERLLSKVNIFASILFGLATLVLSIKTASDSRAIDKKNEQIEKLEKTVDSLTKKH